MTIEIVEFIQSLQNGFFDLFFNFISFMGEEYVYIILLTIVYYAYDKKLGEMLGYVLIVSTALNTILKHIFSAERPFAKYPDRVDNLRPHTSPGYSFPSGHTQVFTSVIFSIGFYVKKNSVLSIVAGLSLLMAISRMYLGVHFLEDVFVSLVLGVSLSHLYYTIFMKHHENPKTMMKIYIGTLIILLIILFVLKTKTYITTVGMFAGFIAAMWFEKRYVNFTMEVSMIQKGIRVLSGVAIMLMIQVGFKAIYGSIFDNESILLVFDFIRYFLLVFIGLGVYPYFFKKLGI